MNLTDQIRFNRIVRIARATNPFYCEWISDASSIPIVDRLTFLQNNDRILNGFTPDESTSGSTGVPVRIAYGPRHAENNLADKLTMSKWLGRSQVTSRIVHPRATSKSDDTLDINTPLTDQLNFIKYRYQTAGAKTLNTYPCNIVEIAKHLLERGKTLPFLERITLLSEQFDDWQRKVVQDAFPQAYIWSCYSSMEFGMIAAQCPYESSFSHLFTHKMRIEVLDDNGEECANDIPGHIVITDYENTHCPFIRYEIGDLATKGICPCGKINSPAFSAIHGKIRGTLVDKKGNRVFFSNLSVAIRDEPSVVQYQVIQKSLDHFIFNLVLKPGCSVPDEHLRKQLQIHLGLNPKNLETNLVSHIPRSPSGKFFASICEIH